MPTFNGQLRTNEIFGSIYNMIISQEVFANNINDTYATLADRMRVDGSMYGDQKLYYSTDVLKSVEWGGDAEAQNLLALHRPKAPKVQSIIIDKFRQIAVTVDNYLSKRAFSTEGAFSQFNSVMLGWLRETKKIYDSTLMNSYIGTTESGAGKQTQSITLPTEENAEAQSRRQAQFISKTIADILVGVRDITRDYNDNAFLRSFSPKDMIVVWNADFYNKITNLDLPTIFHKDELFKDLDEMTLPARYFGSVNVSGGTASELNSTIRSLIETDYAVESLEDDERAELINGQYVVHVFPGDLLPGGSVYLANQTYTEDADVICKIIHARSVPFMSGFEVGTSFFNPKSLTETQYLTFGHNTLEYLQNFPFITLRAE